MTQEWMIRTLVHLGFGKRAAEVYVFLTLNGSQQASAIAEALRTYERQICHILQELQNREVVSGSQDLPARFSALPFDRLLNVIAEANLQEARRIEQKKDVLLGLWNSYVKKQAKESDN